MNKMTLAHSEYNTKGIHLWSHLDAPYSEDILKMLMQPHTSENYFLMFLNKGSVEYSVDLEKVHVEQGQVLFIKPNQVRMPPSSKGDSEYFKITFDPDIFSLLPNQCHFWLDPLSQQKVTMSKDAWLRMNSALQLLRTALQTDTPHNLTIAYLNAVLLELENAYFAEDKNPIHKKYVEPFIKFQTLVEETFSAQPTVSDIAKSLALSEASLYKIVKTAANMSPKEYLNKRIILEAKRLLTYSNDSVKELAHTLGFHDENYFSRFFRKHTDQSISMFLRELKDLSR